MTDVIETLKLFSSKQCLDIMKYLVVNGPTRYYILALEMEQIYGNSANLTNMSLKLRKAGHVRVLYDNSHGRGSIDNDGKARYYMATIKSPLVKAIIDAYVSPTPPLEVPALQDADIHVRVSRLFGDRPAGFDV